MVRAGLHDEHALAALIALATETLFQAESDEVPIQVLGVLEAAGMDFDALWIAGLTSDAWPAAPRKRKPEEVA